MAIMLARLGTGPSDAHDAGPPLVLPQRSGGLMLVLLLTGQADAHDAGDAGDWPS